MASYKKNVDNILTQAFDNEKIVKLIGDAIYNPRVSKVDMIILLSKNKVKLGKISSKSVDKHKRINKQRTRPSYDGEEGAIFEISETSLIVVATHMGFNTTEFRKLKKDDKVVFCINKFNDYPYTDMDPELQEKILSFFKVKDMETIYNALKNYEPGKAKVKKEKEIKTLKDLSGKQLQALCRKQKLKGYSKWKKKRAISELDEYYPDGDLDEETITFLEEESKPKAKRPGKDDLTNMIRKIKKKFSSKRYTVDDLIVKAIKYNNDDFEAWFKKNNSNFDYDEYKEEIMAGEDAGDEEVATKKVKGKGKKTKGKSEEKKEPDEKKSDEKKSDEKDDGEMIQSSEDSDDELD